jgi:hypothetical protein
MENFIQVEKDDKKQKALEEKIKLFIAAQDLQILSIPMIFIPKRKFHYYSRNKIRGLC